MTTNVRIELIKRGISSLRIADWSLIFTKLIVSNSFPDSMKVCLFESTADEGFVLPIRYHDPYLPEKTGRFYVHS